MESEKPRRRQTNQNKNNNNSRPHEKRQKVSQDEIYQLLFMNKNPSKKSIDYLQNRLQHMPIGLCHKIVGNSIHSKKDFQKTSEIAHIIIMKFLDYSLELNFLQAYLQVLTKNKKYQNLYQLKELESLVEEIPLRILPYYYEAFPIKLPNEKRIQGMVQTILDKKIYHAALKFAEVCGSRKILDLIVFSPTITKKQAIKTVIKLGYGKKDYPELESQMLQGSLFYFLREEGYQYIEQIFMVFPKLLLLGLLKGLHNNNKIALSICKRHPQLMNYMTFQQRKKFQVKIDSLKVVIPNSLQNDKFLPSDPDSCIKFSDYGLKENDVIMIQEDSPQLQKYLDLIKSTKHIGIDTQSRVARSKFDSQADVIEIIQIATRNNVYIFDAKTCSKSGLIRKTFQEYFSNPDKVIIGHTTGQDFSSTASIFLGQNHKVPIRCQIVDIKEKFKELYPDQRCGLATICETILQKTLCKKYTLTNWCRRPLLKNQIHYAAMDAYIVLVLYPKLYQEV